ncbi:MULTISPECIES: BlaI/MecI/CopY family transcriptional regulator [Hymenobacter]|uniref:BlaI/MecI/CopY family transcriptional regulator n=1 Tax=Hymenobacter guriensis TaxID=2793065 RepID=A0ABS0L4Z6_9BACT|nr:MULTISPECIES: BlaI/MecI/CopY family transcriptional regulator [Hymenobacter]MBG8555233.1 BlaI/MecI/CopY family transcriptional regulator [Hymenobacter guriensis]MCR5888253.1 BlaI/MecI/CopY family transcriptional regulator [Hymenobacter sp. J193]
MERLTQPEEDAMRVFWQLNGGFIKEVLEQLPEPRPPYTTLASTVRNLERKGYLRGEKLGNTFRFTPLIPAEEYRKRFLGTFVGDYFRNSYKELVSFFAQDQKISAQELQEIIELIERQKPPQK